MKEIKKWKKQIKLMNQNPGSQEFNKIKKSLAKWIEVKGERAQKCKKLHWEKLLTKRKV